MKNQKIVTYQGMNFKKYITEEKIKLETLRVAQEITTNFKEKNLLIIGILNGAFMWTADLVREVDLSDCQIEFVKISSYEGVESTGEVKNLIGLKQSIKGRNVLIVEDIIDTGKSMVEILNYFKDKDPNSVSIASLFFKKEKCQYDIKIDYLGFEIENKFIIGYGLDLDEYARNLKDVWILDQ